MKVSLHLGLNGVNPTAYNGWPGWLNACISDARDMAALFSRAGFTAKAMFDHSCTIEALDREVSAQALILEIGDQFALTYSGHGGQSPAWGFSGYKETLCLYDGQYSDTALRELFAQFKPGVRIIFISDSCHSGGMSRTMQVTRNKPPSVKSDVILPSKAEQDDLAASVLLLAACQTDELAGDGESNGVFTAALLKVADDFEANSRPLIYDEWIVAVQSLMLQNNPTQHPVIERYGAPADWNVDVTDP